MTPRPAPCGPWLFWYSTAVPVVQPQNEHLPFDGAVFKLLAMTAKPTPFISITTRCNLITAGILLIGLGLALGIYLTAGEPPENPFAEYENSKRFSLEVQRMGGKMALVANDLTAWFAGLWQGRQLAWTVAGITLVVAGLYYLIASGRQPGDERVKTQGDDDDAATKP